MTEESEMPYSLQNGVSSEEDGKSVSHLKKDAPIPRDSTVILNQSCLDAEDSKLHQENIENDRNGADEERENSDTTDVRNGHKYLPEEGSVEKLDTSLEVNNVGENQSTIVVNEFDNLDRNKNIPSDSKDLDVSCQEDVVDVLVSKESDLSSNKTGSNTEDGNHESLQDLWQGAEISSDQDSQIEVNCDVDLNDSDINSNIAKNLSKTPTDSNFANLEGLLENTPKQSNVDDSVSTSLERLPENSKKINVGDSKGERSLDNTSSSELSLELTTPGENLVSNLDKTTCLGEGDAEETSHEIVEVEGEDLLKSDTGVKNLEDIEMGKKSGSFSKKSGSLYVYSKDEFRESYQNNPKPKPATRFSRSKPKVKPKVPHRSYSQHDTPASSSEGIPSHRSTEDRHNESRSLGLEQSTAQSPEVHSGTPSSPERRTSHSHVTVELLSSDKKSSSHAKPESIDHSFVVTASDRDEQSEPRSSQGDGPSSETDANKAKLRPIPAPRLSTSSSPSTPPTPKSAEPKGGAEHYAQQHEQSEVGTVTVSSPPVFPQLDLVSPKIAKSPELSEIMCITRTVDGEEELILGAGPMFANQQKLTMESAIAKDVSRSLLAHDRASVTALGENSQSGPRGYKNYACIEPVGEPVESQVIAREAEVKENGVKEDDEVFHNGDIKKPPASDITKNKVDSDDGSLDDDEDDDDVGINDAAYRISDWMYLGSGKELSIVNGKEGGDLGESLEDSTEEDNLKRSSGLQSSNSMDSIETTPSEKEFKNHYPSLSLRRVKREGSVLGYRKLTDITREREVVINFDEKAKSYGFRIQYSKPAIVTEVDTGGAAEQKGLRVGDVILGVNGTDVRKAPHATVVKLVQTGPPELHLLVGTNMCNSPNQDLYKPIKTGYMHKLGGQGMLKNWKKRWFVLKHDGCLYYYKTKDEIDPLGAVVLTNYTLVKARDAGKQHAFKISKYKARTYYFYTETEEDMNSWAKAITEAAWKKTSADVWLDISTHNVGLPALSIKSPDCRGFLIKQGNVHKSWKKRYCVLKDACMYYYTDMKQPQALGIVHFHGYKIQETELAGKKYGFVLEPPIPQLRTYYFIAENETDRKRWVASLATSIGRWIQTNEEDEFSKAENKDEEMLI